LIVYEWALKGPQQLGWIAAFVYCSRAALLTPASTTLRWSTSASSGPPKGGRCAIIGFIWVMDDAGKGVNHRLAVVVGLGMLYAGCAW
jgi:hypothetical protein